MAYPFTEIIIVYNPNSTGSSRANAMKLQKRLKGELSKDVRITTLATKSSGHAEEIGKEYAKRDTKTLLISSSGDGGYNEMINGVLKYAAKHVVTAVMPSGNANDHYHATATDDLVRRIVVAKKREIDVLEVTAKQDSRPWKRYAHSYVGVGMTAYIGKKLTQSNLNALNEKWMVLRYMIRFGHVSVKLDGAKSWRRYTNVICANIDRMSKVIKLSENAKVDDGQCELYTSTGGTFWRTFRYLLLGSTIGLTPIKRTNTITFELKRPSMVQLDGEVMTIDGEVMIRTRKKALQTV